MEETPSKKISLGTTNVIPPSESRQRGHFSDSEENKQPWGIHPLLNSRESHSSSKMSPTASQEQGVLGMQVTGWLIFITGGKFKRVEQKQPFLMQPTLTLGDVALQEHVFCPSRATATFPAHKRLWLILFFFPRPSSFPRHQTWPGAHPKLSRSTHALQLFHSSQHCKTVL